MRNLWILITFSMVLLICTAQVYRAPSATGFMGLLGLSKGGTGSDLSATGGTSQVLKQTISGAAVTVGRLACSDLSNSVNGCSNANENTPPWLRYFGDGSDGAFTCPSGTCNVTAEHLYSSFNVSAGAIVANTTNSYPLIVRSTGTCTIAGTVSASVNSGSAAGSTGQGDFGGSGGGGGGGAGAGAAGVSTVGSGIHVVNLGGTAGGVTGGNAGNGATPGAQFRSMLANGTPWPIGGAGGGAGGSGGGAGGMGGGTVIFVCNTINFTGTIDVSGGAGGVSSANSVGPGGGGGGGYAILSAITYTANSGTVTVSGGAGGSCNSHTTCGTAGTGGNGWSASFTIQ